MIDTVAALKLIEGRYWHHDFEIIPGVRTRGSYDPSGMWNELQLADSLSGVSLADVGASNGYFSFEAHRRGARVVAFDYRHKDNSGFGLAQHINGMTGIEHNQIDILDLPAGIYGRFEIVLALGLLYHTADPYRALANCAALSSHRLFLESYCIDELLPKDLQREPVMRFIADPVRLPAYGHVNNDRSNFWGFTSECLRRMTEDNGFAVRRVNVRGDRVFIEAERVVEDERLTRMCFAYGILPHTPVGKNPDDAAAWTIF